MRKVLIYVMLFGPYAYVGSTCRGAIRINEEHAPQLEAGTHENQYMQSAFNQYGITMAKFVDETIEEYRILLEQHWYELYRDSGYQMVNRVEPNHCLTNPYQNHILEETRKKISVGTKAGMNNPEVRRKVSDGPRLWAANGGSKIISERTKLAMQRPEVRERYLRGYYKASDKRKTNQLLAERRPDVIAKRKANGKRYSESVEFRKSVSNGVRRQWQNDAKRDALLSGIRNFHANKHSFSLNTVQTRFSNILRKLKSKDLHLKIGITLLFKKTAKYLSLYGILDR